jgi:hypothetical protein
MVVYRKTLKLSFWRDRKVALLNDIIKMNDLIAKFSESIMTNQSLGDLIVMSDCGNIDESGNGCVDSTQSDSGSITITTQSIVVHNETENAELPVSLVPAVYE